MAINDLDQMTTVAKMLPLLIKLLKSLLYDLDPHDQFAKSAKKDLSSCFFRWNDLNPLIWSAYTTYMYGKTRSFRETCVFHGKKIVVKVVKQKREVDR